MVTMEKPLEIAIISIAESITDVDYATIKAAILDEYGHLKVDHMEVLRTLKSTTIPYISHLVHGGYVTRI